MSDVKERRGDKAQAAPRSKAARAATTSAKTGPVVDADNVGTREKRQQEAYGAGVLTVMFALNDAAEDDKRIPRMVQAAKLFLIAVAFIAPVLLMWQHAF